MTEVSYPFGRVGIWTFTFDTQPIKTVREAAATIEELGFGTIWFGEAFGREAVSQAALLLDATRRIVIAPGVTGIYGRDAFTMAQTERTIHEAFPGRFVLGLGVSHPMVVEQLRGHTFGPPVPTMRNYLDTMDATQFVDNEQPRPPRVLAGIGPKMLALAAERTLGPHTYFVPVAHTARTRAALGPGPVIAVEQAVVLDSNVRAARDIAREHVAAYRVGAQYDRVLREFGLDEPHADVPTDRQVDALVACGGVDVAVQRVQQQLDAGADHVCLQVLTSDPTKLPMDEWSALGEALF